MAIFVALRDGEKAVNGTRPSLHQQSNNITPNEQRQRGGEHEGENGIPTRAAQPPSRGPASASEIVEDERGV